MKRDPIQANVLATKLIPNVSPGMAKELNLKPEQRSLALITADCDDVTYTALDEATKKADVQVVYAKSFYGGALLTGSQSACKAACDAFAQAVEFVADNPIE